MTKLIHPSEGSHFENEYLVPVAYCVDCHHRHCLDEITGKVGECSEFECECRGSSLESIVWAQFIGWQTMLDNEPPVALYNIKGDHELRGSTVSAETLNELKIPVPYTPAPAGGRHERT